MIRRGLVFLLLGLVLGALSLVGWFQKPVQFDGGVILRSATLSDVPGRLHAIHLDLQFDHIADILSTGDFAFIHGEEQDAECPLNASVSIQNTGNARIDIELPPTCVPGRESIFIGIWNSRSNLRRKLLSPTVFDHRIALGNYPILTPDTEPVTRKTLALRWVYLTQLIAPIWVWLGGLFIALAAAVALTPRRGPNPIHPVPSLKLIKNLRFQTLYLFIPVIPFIICTLIVLEFIKDDAYITFRYSHNLIAGKGLVFNTGDHLEGFTNFLWMLLMAPFEALHLDLFQVCEVLGTIISLVIIYVLGKIAIRWGKGFDFTVIWASLWLATSGSWTLWAKSGLESPLAGLLPFLAYYELLRAEDSKSRSRAAYAGLLAALAAMTRPELHLFGAIFAIPWVFDSIRTRKFAPLLQSYLLALFGLLVPFHAFRLAYFHSLIQNTVFVKTTANFNIWQVGIHTLGDMLAFNRLGFVLWFVPFAFLNKHLVREKLLATSIVIVFLIFIVRVGVDEMQWYRLFIPALPFSILLATHGLKNLKDRLNFLLSNWESKRLLRTIPLVIVSWAVLLTSCFLNVSDSYKEYNGFNGHGDLAGGCHPDIGKFVTRHERPRGLVAFQDIGSAPYHAPDIDWLDLIGLVDREIARSRYQYGLHAFTGSEGNPNQAKFEKEMRDYFFNVRHPEWAILTAYPPKAQEAIIFEQFEKNPGPEAFSSSLSTNSYQFGLWDDPRFRERYVHVRTWAHGTNNYFALFRRRDLWEQTPREVVLDAPPADLSGPSFEWEGGLKMLGASVPPQAIERHEFFVTTWWSLPGPMPKDTYFFIHLTSPRGNTPYDHIPGDWMYPANRWIRGQILEDRVLFEIPFDAALGDYEVFFGIYRRATGQRLRVIVGPTDGQDRVKIGTIKITPLRLFWNHIIQPTDPSKMRAHEDRIVHSPGRN